MLFLLVLMPVSPHAGENHVAAGSLASGGDQDFKDWLEALRREAREQGISEATLDASLIGISPVTRVIELGSRSGHRGLGRSTGCRGLAVSLAEFGEWATSPVVCPAELPHDESATRLHEGCGRFPASEPALLAALSGALDSAASVFIGNSLPIREWNLVSLGMPARSCHAARGANGIDGQVSHGLGLGSHEREVWVVVGDLTALYDLSAPSWIGQMAKRQPGLRVRLVVVNNGGGRIFARLPAFGGLDEDQRKVTENRHNLGFEGWARLWGFEHRVVCNAGEVCREMAASLPALVVLELRPDEGENSGFWQWWQGEPRVNPRADGG